MSDLKLHDAVKARDYAEAERLIKDGADPNQQDELGWTPLSFAAGNGELSLVELLAANGADIFKVGRDQRTPYMIALAAGRVSVVRCLRQLEDQHPGQKPPRPDRQYCKAYQLHDLRRYPMWSESRINWEKKIGDANGNGDSNDSFPDEKIVFVHQDFSVTESMWHNENVLFNDVDSAWEAFCAESLNFKVPDDIDLIVPNEKNA